MHLPVNRRGLDKGYIEGRNRRLSIRPSGPTRGDGRRGSVV